MFDGQARHHGGAINYYASTEAFVDHVSRVIELGITDIGVYYPLDPAQLLVFEEIAANAIPMLRLKHTMA